MFEFLSGEVLRWAIGLLVTIFIAIASLFVPSLLSRRRKTLWYRESSYPLVERRRKDERIEILFDGESVPDVYISVIGLWYRGTSALVEDDYRTPVTIDFGDTQILDAEIGDLSPEGLPAELSVENSRKVIFSPVAMNDDNAVRARVLLTSRPKEPEVTGHILNVKLRDYRERQTLPDRVFRVFMTIAMVGLALSLIGGILLIFSSDNTVPLTLAFLMFGGIGLVLLTSFSFVAITILIDRAIDKSPI